jgi:crotonobetainyl-CoA:carnitine CoA-transferase CaiB-like acyl-CoA transferase
MKQMFEDLLVIDAASFLAGPGAATIMADFGARVIKMGIGYSTVVIDMISIGP